MTCRISILIDGGFLRVNAKRAGHTYDNRFIKTFAHACKATDETIFRIMYYDCALFTGTVTLPVSNTQQKIEASDKWLNALASKDLFAVRRGVLKFRGFRPKNTPVQPNSTLTDGDFEPIYEQKGVDMRIGLDIAAYAANHAVDRIVLVSNDTDCVPAMKYGRKAGLQVVLIQLPNCHPAKELKPHADFRRKVAWPSPSSETSTSK